MIVGVVGAGQLARMLALAGIPLGFLRGESGRLIERAAREEAPAPADQGYPPCREEHGRSTSATGRRLLPPRAATG